MKKILIVANPHSGKKQGEKILNDIFNIFKNNPYDIIKTTHKNHPLEDKTTVEAMQSSIRDELDKSLVSN